MSQIAEATLMDGRKIQYVIKENPPRGGMKYTYFAPDKSYVVQFFNNPEVTNDPNLRKRIEAILHPSGCGRRESDPAHWGLEQLRCGLC